MRRRSTSSGVIGRSVPWRAKTWAYDQLMETDALKLTLPWVVAETEETQYLYEQHLAPRVVPIEELLTTAR